MLKNVFSIVTLFLTIISLNLSAQHLQAQQFDSNKKAPLCTSRAVTTTLPLGDNEYWWGYYDGSFDDIQMIGQGLQSKYPQSYIAATCYTAGTKELEGRTIEGLSFSFPSSKNITDVKIWISENLPTSAEEATFICQSVDKVTGYEVKDDQFNEVRFDKPYTIDSSKDVYVGYSFVVSKNGGMLDQYPVYVTGKTGHTRGLRVKVGGSDEWMSYEEYNFGDLAVRLLLGGGDFEQNSVSIDDTFHDVAAVKGGEVDIPLTVKNLGGNGFTNLDVIVDIAGEKQNITVTPDSKVIGVGTISNLNIKATVPAVTGTYPLTLTIDKVNDVANTSKNNISVANLNVVSRIVDRKVLFEEFTATWCGFCPRGAVGIEKAEQVYGDKIVPVCVHYQDQMGSVDYPALIKATVVGFPSSHLNRTYMDIDPYYGDTGTKKFGISELIDKCIADVPLAEIKASYTVEGDVLTAIADTKFLFTGDVACAVGFILTADGLQNEEWWQGNNFSGSKGFEDEPLFDKWVNAESKAKGVIYDDVVISAIGVEKGYNQCVMTEAVEEESNIHELKFNLNDYPVIQDKSKLNVCVFLFDRKTNHVMNADRIAVDATTGIDNIEAEGVESDEVARYTIDGRRINGEEKGINLIKYSDGKVKKVIVR